VSAAAAAAPARPPRGPKQYLGLYFRGLCMGGADVVPGVSGGTMAFILGIYEELVDSIRAMARPPFLRAILGLRIGDAARAANLPFLLAVGAGIATAILSLARLLLYLLDHYPVLVWSFFFGLVLASVVVVTDRIGRWTPGLLLGAGVGGVGAYWFVGLVPTQTPDTWWFLFLSGALAICAMILPGISGAFVLVLLGKYQYVLNALLQRDVVTLAFFLSGIVVGIVSFAQLLGWLFRRYHDPTVAVLSGLMLGSLRKVWPWKHDLATIVDRHGKTIPTAQENVLPQWSVAGAFNAEIAAALVAALVGFGLVVVLERWARRSSR